MNQENVVTLTNVTKSFGSGENLVTALRDVSLQINSGEIVALLGPNGSGKSTALDVALGLLEPDSGSAALFGITPKQAICEGKVGVLFQSGSLLPDLTVQETLEMVAALHHGGRSVAEVMQRSGISDIAKRRVGKCSGGQQQKLRFALALLPDPQLLILDEPTVGMDVTARQAFWAALEQEAAMGRTIIFATHYLQEAADFAQRVIVLDAGKVIADDSVINLQNRVSRKTVTAQWPDATAAQLQQIPAAVKLHCSGDRVAIETTDADAVARYLLTATTATQLEIAVASLENIFTMLTNAEESQNV
ncbi:ABC transporter ATP-binding protein [Leucobacter sp. OH2974_COT-288]|nr:ABC transporter ATP-binding protein [Leucobacter sp. OH2974_COT-288]